MLEAQIFRIGNPSRLLAMTIAENLTLRSASNLRKIRIRGLILEGSDLADEVLGDDSFIIRADFRKHAAVPLSLIAEAWKAGNLPAFKALYLAGHRFSNKYGTSIEDGVYFNVFRARGKLPTLPLEWAAFLSSQDSGVGLQHWAENSRDWFGGGIPTFESLKSLGFHPSVVCFNGLLLRLFCGLFTPQHGPEMAALIKQFVAEGLAVPQREDLVRVVNRWMDGSHPDLMRVRAEEVGIFAIVSPHLPW